MEVLKTASPVVYPHLANAVGMKEIERQRFEAQWNSSISDEEFVQQVHDHIDALYDAGCPE
jgi:hypothetical protein